MQFSMTHLDHNPWMDTLATTTQGRKSPKGTTDLEYVMTLLTTLDLVTNAKGTSQSITRSLTLNSRQYKSLMKYRAKSAKI